MRRFALRACPTFKHIHIHSITVNSSIGKSLPAQTYACTSRDPQDMCGMQGDDRVHAEGIHSTPLEPQSSDTSADRASCERQGQQCIVSDRASSASRASGRCSQQSTATARPLTALTARNMHSLLTTHHGTLAPYRGALLPIEGPCSPSSVQLT